MVAKQTTGTLRLYNSCAARVNRNNTHSKSHSEAGLVDILLDFMLTVMTPCSFYYPTSAHC